MNFCRNANPNKGVYVKPNTTLKIPRLFAKQTTQQSLYLSLSPTVHTVSSYILFTKEQNFSTELPRRHLKVPIEESRSEGAQRRAGAREKVMNHRDSCKFVQSSSRVS